MRLELPTSNYNTPLYCYCGRLENELHVICYLGMALAPKHTFTQKQSSGR